MNPEEILQKLNAYAFHDLPVESVGWTEVSKDFKLSIFLYKEKKKGYDKLTLFFKHVEAFVSDHLEYEQSELELYKFSYQYKEKFNCSLLFLQGFNSPSLQIDFTCATIEIKEDVLT